MKIVDCERNRSTRKIGQAKKDTARRNLHANTTRT